MPNLIIRFGTCKVRRTNQLGTALLYLDRLRRSIRLSLSNRMAKYVQTDILINQSETLFDFEFVDSKIANISEMKNWLVN